MYLKKHIVNLNKKKNRLTFSGISFDSTKVKKNYIFFAIKGNNVDGNNYINQAIKKGAKIIISEREIEKRSMMKHGGKHNDRIMYAGGGEVLTPN